MQVRGHESGFLSVFFLRLAFYFPAGYALVFISFFIFRRPEFAGKLLSSLSDLRNISLVILFEQLVELYIVVHCTTI
jgi:hypothetical protein